MLCVHKTHSFACFELRRGGGMHVSRRLLACVVCSAWIGGVVMFAQTGQPQAGQASATPRPPRPLDPKLLNLTSAGPNRPDEPFAKTLSLEKTRDFLDEMAVNWTRDRKCGTCHSNIPYMIGRAALGPHTPAADEVRNFFVDRATRWDSMGNLLIRGDVATNKGWGLVTWFPHEVIVTAAGLAMDDAGTTGTLAPLTRQVLDRMWTLQRQDGGFYWLMATSHPFETSEYLRERARGGRCRDGARRVREDPGRQGRTEEAWRVPQREEHHRDLPA